ncbi:MAG: helix-hairpin-helix domain-containing protein [Eubacteriales bacterium]|nr:helix-hairpin-helix domain-containing protein [Eubacteriales bacterium]
MNKKLHFLYIVIILLLVLMNIAIYKGKSGQFLNVDGNYNYRPPQQEVSDEPESVVIELNSATAKELMEIKGIGEALSERIVNRREEIGGFKMKEELLSVEGIGPGIFDNIKEYVYVEEAGN